MSGVRAPCQGKLPLGGSRATGGGPAALTRRAGRRRLRHRPRRGGERLPPPSRVGCPGPTASTLEVAVILIVLKVKIKPAKREDWLAGIKEYTDNVRAEPGNVSFDFYESGTTPNEFAIVETFRDGDA